MNTLRNCNTTILIVAMIAASSDINALSASSGYFKATMFTFTLFVRAYVDVFAERFSFPIDCVKATSSKCNI